MEEKKKPADKKRFGDVEAALWGNETEKGCIYNVTFSRVYKTAEGRLRNTGSYGSRDVFNLVRAALWAYAQIGERRSFEREAESIDEPEHIAA